MCRHYMILNYVTVVANVSCFCYVSKIRMVSLIKVINKQLLLLDFDYLHLQQFTGVLWNNCIENFCRIHWKDLRWSQSFRPVKKNNSICKFFLVNFVIFFINSKFIEHHRLTPPVLDFVTVNKTYNY